MRTIGISHKTRYWQQYCFAHPPAGYRYRRMIDIPWHLLGITTEVLAHTKLFLPPRRADIYHTYNGVVVNNRPWVVEVEDYLPRYEALRHDHPLYKWALRRLAGRHCKGLIFTSHRAMARNVDHLTAAGVDPAKMQVIYRAVEQYEPLPRNPDRFTVLFAGNGFYRKGGVELLKAFSRLDRPELRLVIISGLEVDWGLCPLPGVKVWAEQTIDEDPRISRHGILPHDQVIDQMRRADLFVATTFQDPFNNTVLEAMGTGLPVICSTAGALPEVAQDGRNGWMLDLDRFSSDDIADRIAEHITELMDNAELRLRMGRESEAIVTERFTLEVRNKALKALYDEALS